MDNQWLRMLIFFALLLIIAASVYIFLIGGTDPDIIAPGPAGVDYSTTGEV